MADEQIEEVLGQSVSRAEACGGLISRANAAGGEDNITVLLVGVKDEEKYSGRA